MAAQQGSEGKQINQLNGERAKQTTRCAAFALYRAASLLNTKTALMPLRAYASRVRFGSEGCAANKAVVTVDF
jgi:hypothetical protein